VRFVTATGAARVASLLLATAAWTLGAGGIMAASPDPTSAPVGDPRSSGQGPGLVGDPLFAILVVVAIALLTLAVTLAYVRVTDARRRSGQSS
jgi:hypothetical protein